MEPSTVLTALAELAPTGQRGDELLDATRGRALVWLAGPGRVRRSRAADRLAAMDVLHRDERLLRRGWAFVLGTVDADGGKRRVRLPLLCEPVRMQRSRSGYRIVTAGDLELTPLVTDRELAARLESAPGVGSADWLADPATLAWVREAAQAAGLPLTDLVQATPNVLRGQTARTGWPPKPPERGVLGVAGAALYVARDAFGGGIPDTLLSWAGRDGLAQTALAAVYGAGPAAAGDGDGDGGGDGAGNGEVRSPLPLSEAQTEVVRRARTEPVAVVSGPPGSGKSHAVVAAALEVVDRGGSVLLATQSTHAADVLGELLERYPGPTPVLFGDAERREAIAAELAAGAGRGHPERTLRADAAAVADATDRVRQLAAAVEAALRLEQRAAELARWEPLLPALRSEAPGAFAGGTDLDRAASLADLAAAPGDGWWRRWRAQRAGRRLRAALGAAASAPVDRLRSAIEAGRTVHAAAALTASGGTDLSVAWSALHEAEAVLASAVGTAMRHRATSARRWTPAARASVAGLASALRAGRNRRRELLAGMDGADIGRRRGAAEQAGRSSGRKAENIGRQRGAAEQAERSSGRKAENLVRALPLWVGTAADTEDLLPPVPGLFDLVILDEASHLDQLRAAPVLARARRALVVGDPRQLRFVSFVADVDIAATLHRHGLDDRLDVRRVSAFDLAAGAAPVTWLDEHYRSVPHLIEFSARRFYGRAGQGGLAVATRHPANDSRDVIDLVRVAGGAVTRGVNAAEVTAAVGVVRELAERGERGVAVVSPFRAQVDALETALLNVFSVEELERLGLRVGTVHAFQGSEARTVVVSLGLVDGDAAARVRFVTDPHLFNVLVTRARERMVVVTSLSEGPGLVGEYLAYGEAGPTPPGAEGSDHLWTAALAGELRRAGLTVRCDYPVGHWRVDLCVGEGAGAVGLTTRVHPDGTEAHRRRQAALARAGWRLVDAYPSRWAGDPVRAALELNHSTLLHQGVGSAT